MDTGKQQVLFAALFWIIFFAWIIVGRKQNDDDDSRWL